MKYVMFDSGKFVIIPEFMSHIDVVSDYERTGVSSAGFVQFYSGVTQAGETVIKAKCFGKSFTLGKEADPEYDSIRISVGM